MLVKTVIISTSHFFPLRAKRRKYLLRLWFCSNHKTLQKVVFIFAMLSWILHSIHNLLSFDRFGSFWIPNCHFFFAKFYIFCCFFLILQHIKCRKIDAFEHKVVEEMMGKKPQKRFSQNTVQHSRNNISLEEYIRFFQ